MASECVVSENECFPTGSVSLKNAAVLAQGHGTALLAFTKYCELKENDCIIVIAGPGKLTPSHWHIFPFAYEFFL